MMSTMFFVLRGGCPWRMLPEQFPPHQTVHRWFTRFRDDRIWERLNHVQVMQDRERVAREASTSAAVIDSQRSRSSKQVPPGDMMPARRSTGVSVTPWSTWMAED